MRKLWIAAMVVGLLPAMAFADRHSSRGSYRGGYDRGARYGGDWGHRSSRNFFDISVGFGSRSWGGDYSYSRFSYGNYPRYRPAPVYVPTYCPPPVVVYQEPVYCPPPAVVYPAPVYYPAPQVYGGPQYYYNNCSSGPSVYYRSESRYYYGR